MKPHLILGAACALALGASGAPVQAAPALALPTLAPAVETTVPATLTLTRPDALAGLDFGLAAGYQSGVIVAPRGWARPGFYAPRWGGAFMYRPRRFAAHRWINETVWYEPRRPVVPPPSPKVTEPPHASSPSRMVVPLQIHGGVFARDENAPRSYAAGLRGGPAIDKHLQIGLGADWYHRTDSEREVVADTMQAGQSVKVTRVLSQATSDLIPVQAFLQLSLGKGLVPYAGIAGEYQFLLLAATDNTTGGRFNANYGGLGWQAWGGLGLDVGRARLFGELFMNQGDVERNVTDPVSGAPYRETINADGGGLRCGLSWGF